MNKIISFVKQFTKENIIELSTVRKMGRKYTIEPTSVEKTRVELEKNSKSEIQISGLSLGEIKDGKFKPSVKLLEIISQHNPASAIVNKKAETMFLYSNNILAEGITSINRIKGTVLILNDKNEVLGYGSIKTDRNSNTIITNDFNISDFLKREKKFK